MNTKKVMSIALALFLNAGIITACSQTPNTVDPSPTVTPTISPTSSASAAASTTGDTSTVVTDNSGTVSGDTSTSVNGDQNTVSSEVQSDIQDDETTIDDSEAVAQTASFSTKATSEAKVDAEAKINKGKGLGLRPILAKILGKNAREKLIDDSEKVLKAKIKLNEAKLKALKSFNKSNTLKRKNIDVQNSDTVEVTNSDGTISKITSVKFQGKTETSTRENKVIKTYASDGTTLIKVEHYLTVDFPNFDRTYTKIVNYNNDGSKKVVVKSESKWTDGKSRVVNEERNIDASGSGTGVGTVVVTKKDGTTKTYDINVTIKADRINITPVNPAPTPTAEPTIAPTAEPTAVPTENPSPTATATTAVEVEVNTSVETNI